MGEYSKSAIIRYTRRARSMTQEELAEGICDPVTLSRYETGQLNPGDEKFMQLMEKMGERSGLCLFSVKGEPACREKEMEEIKYAMECYDWNLVREKVEAVLKQYHFSMEYPQNRQYIKRIQVVLDYNEGRMDAKAAVLGLQKAFRITIDDCEPEQFEVGKVMSETELLILINLASFYKLNGELERSLELYRRLDSYFNREDMVNDEKPRYICYLGYANLLGNLGRYDESIAVCEGEIRRMLGNNQMNCIYNFYYNIGWNMVNKIKSGKENREQLRSAKCYVWAAYQLCRLYPENKSNLKRIEEFYSSI